MEKVVFDCNVFWQIFFSKSGIGARCWHLVATGQVKLIVSQYVLDEIQDVLTRPETQSKFSQATEENVANFIDELINFAVFVPTVSNAFEYPRDPKDVPYINLAVQEDANYIVSRDKDLLDLMTGYDEESKQFRQRFRPLKVVDTLTFVQTIEKES